MMSDEPDEDLSEDGDDIVLDVVTTLDSNPTPGAKPFCDDWPREACINQTAKACPIVALGSYCVEPARRRSSGIHVKRYGFSALGSPIGSG